MTNSRGAGVVLVASVLVAAQLLQAQTRPLSGADDSEFDAQCAWCHGSGGAGPTLQRPDLRYARTDADLTGDR